MWYVLVVGLSNLTLGIGIAVILQRRLQHGLAQLQRLEEHQASQPENRVFEEPEREVKLCTKPRPRKESKPVEDEPLTTGLEAAKLPSAWQSLVSQDAFGSPVLAAAEMLQKHCGQTTAQLAESDSVIQAGGLKPDQQREMLKLLNETVASTKDRCDEIASQFNEHGFEFQSLSKAAIRLEARPVIYHIVPR